MTVEGLEERLKKKARYWKDYEIRNAQWKMKAAQKKRAEAEAKIKSAEAEIKQAEQDFRFGEELLAWATALEVPGL
jgi:multidrug resistance efflux pump